ncbi:unnamed protein product [Calypogeia fissa]
MMMMNSQQQQQQQQQQQAQQRQLVVVVEGTAALGPSWQLLLTEYVEKIVRTFCGFTVPGSQKHSPTTGDMALVVYTNRGTQNGCILQQTGWTSSVDVFFRWLSAIPFMGGGYGDGAVAEGLAEALLLCCPGPNVPPAPPGREFQKHVILIAASNPCRVASAVPSPPVSLPSQSNNGEFHEHWWLADADQIAQVFSLCAVSLSVVAPRQLPPLRNVFAQAKRGGRTTESTPEPQKQYAQHLVLLSDNFVEARLALHRTAVGTNSTASNGLAAKVEQQPVPTAPPGAAQIQGAGVRQPLGAANGIGVMSGRGPNMPMQPITVKTEAVTSGTSLLQSNSNNNLPVPMQPVPSSAPIPSQDTMQAFSSLTSPDPVQDFKALGNIPASQPLRSVGATSLPSLPNNNMMVHSPSQSRHTIGSPSLPPASPLSGLQPSGGGVPVSTMMPTVSGGTGSLSVPQNTLGMNGQSGGVGLIPSTGGLGGGQGVGVGSVHPSYNSGSTTLGGNTMMGSSQPPSAVNVGGPATGQGSVNGLGGQTALNSLNPMVQPGHGLSGQTIMGTVGNAIGSSAIGSSVPGTLMPTAIPQSPGQVQTHGVNNTGVPAPLPPVPTTGTPPQQPTGNSLKYTRLWEGILAGQRKGNVVPIPICKLEGYRQTSSPDTLAADWPATMQIMRLIPQEYMNQKDYQRKAELLVFRPLTPHDFLVQLAEKKLCAVIQLPSQTLLLASAEKPGRMIGMLFPGDMVQIKPQVSSQQQAASGATAQAVAPNNFSQNPLQNQLQGQLPNNQLPNQLPSQLPNQLPNQLPTQLQSQLPNQQPRSQLLPPGPASLHGAGFLP